jgi:hypothetical protein
VKTYTKDSTRYLVSLTSVKLVYANGNTRQVSRVSLLQGIEALHAKEAVMLAKQYSLLS